MKTRRQAVAADDPIFAAIKQHADLLKLEISNRGRVADLKESLPGALATWSWRNCDPDPPAGCADAPEWLAAQRESGDTWRAHNEAVLALLTTAPTTLGGVIALLEYLGTPEFEDNGPDDPVLLFSEAMSTDDEVTAAVAAFPRRLADAIRALIKPMA